MGRYNFSQEANETNRDLSNRINKLQVLSKDEIQRYLPERVDQDELSKIISEVKKASSSEEKEQIILNNIKTASTIVAGVLKIFL